MDRASVVRNSSSRLPRLIAFIWLSAGLLLSPALTQAAQLVIVVDDVGYNLERAQRLVDLPGRLTLGMLPFAPYTPQIARQASRRHKEIILHQPMEPIAANRSQIEQGTLMLAMSDERFDSQFAAALANVPQAVGVNNHTGSLLTQYHEPMNRLMGNIQQRGLFFLDSRTTHLTVAESTAREWHVPTLRRDVFLDNDPSMAAIRRSFQLALEIARRQGHAVVIAHPYGSTLNFLETELDALPADIELASLSDLLRAQQPRIRRFDQTSLALLGSPVSPSISLGR